MFKHPLKLEGIDQGIQFDFTTINRNVALAHSYGNY